MNKTKPLLFLLILLISLVSTSILAPKPDASDTTLSDQEIENWRNTPTDKQREYLKEEFGENIAFSALTNAPVSLYNPNTKILTITGTQGTDTLYLDNLPEGVTDITFNEETGRIEVVIGDNTARFSSDTAFISVTEIHHDDQIAGYEVNGQIIIPEKGTIVHMSSDGTIKIMGSATINGNFIEPSSPTSEYTLHITNDGRTILASMDPLDIDDRAVLRYGTVDITGNKLIFGSGLNPQESIKTSFRLIDLTYPGATEPLADTVTFTVSSPTELAAEGSYCIEPKHNCIASIPIRTDPTPVMPGEKGTWHSTKEHESNVLKIVSVDGQIDSLIINPRYDYIWADAKTENPVNVKQVVVGSNGEISSSLLMAKNNKAYLQLTSDVSSGGVPFYVPGEDFSYTVLDKDKGIYETSGKLYIIDPAKPEGERYIEVTDHIGLKLSTALGLGKEFITLTGSARSSGSGSLSQQGVNIYEKDYDEEKEFFDSFMTQMESINSAKDLWNLYGGVDSDSLSPELRSELDLKFYLKLKQLDPSLSSLDDPEEGDSRLRSLYSSVKNSDVGSTDQALADRVIPMFEERAYSDNIPYTYAESLLDACNYFNSESCFDNYNSVVISPFSQDLDTHGYDALTYDELLQAGPYYNAVEGQYNGDDFYDEAFERLLEDPESLGYANPLAGIDDPRLPQHLRIEYRQRAVEHIILGGNPEAISAIYSRLNYMANRGDMDYFNDDLIEATRILEEAGLR